MSNIAVQNSAPPSFLNKIFGNSSAPNAPATATPTAAPGYSADQVRIANTADPNATQAGFFKKVGDLFGEMGSDLAFSMKMGETYRLIDQEFRQVDFNMDGQLNHGEFTVATLNPFEFQYADRNMDGRLSQKEYANYRKDRLEQSFQQKDMSGDRHLNIGEIGSVGRVFLANRDPRLDSNMDGLVNKREYVRAQLTLGISIRDVLGF